MRRPDRQRALRRAAIALAPAAAALGLAAACSRPSASIDGGDLLGVFEHDGGPDAAPVASAARPKPKAPASSRAPLPAAPDEAPVARLPNEGVCVAKEGSPDGLRKRTVGRPACRSAEVLEWKDAQASPRYACVVAPSGAELRAPLPLVVFFHGELDDATMVDKKTRLRKLGARFDVTHDPAHAGFLVLAPQGRALQSDKQGVSFDAAYTADDNVDVATVDHFVAELEARRLVDPRRIYALGAEGGGRMAATWAMMRADRVAAFAAFGTDAPAASWQCQGPPPPAFVLYRACDTVVPCESVERWLRARDALSAETGSLRLGAGLGEEPLCAIRNKCTSVRGGANHRRWPKGREEDVLRFFARHTLAVAPVEASDAGAPAARR